MSTKIGYRSVFGMVAFAIGGALIAGKRSMVFLAYSRLVYYRVSGGTLHDLLLGIHPRQFDE